MINDDKIGIDSEILKRSKINNYYTLKWLRVKSKIN